MPLSPPAERRFLTQRKVTCQGFLRTDGLLDIEGHLVDTRGFDMLNAWRGPLKAGEPAHEMWVRLSVDDDLVIKSAESATDAAPYPTCREITDHTQRLVGLKIAGGFKQAVRAKVGNTEGCTHIIALIDIMAGVAVQTLAGKRMGRSNDEILSSFSTRGSARPALIDTCHSYAADSLVVQKLWPMHYVPKK